MARNLSIPDLLSGVKEEHVQSLDAATKALEVETAMSAVARDAMTGFVSGAGESFFGNVVNAAIGESSWERFCEAFRGSRQESIEARDKQSLVDGRTPRRK